MKLHTISFPEKEVTIYLDSCISKLHTHLKGRRAIIITDSNVFAHHASLFSSFNTIVINAGENYKNTETILKIIQELIALEADRHTILIGVGGGVVTDITGFVASIYMRGISFGFIPTTILNLVDASIGGKNGVDFGLYKNMIGTIRQPDFILHDYSFLNTLSDFEWENGFAEIIKHACIRDKELLQDLANNSISFYQNTPSSFTDLIYKNILHKSSIVSEDPYEKDIRKLLNFGHTLGHTLERTYNLSHGHAISIGMVLASKISEFRNNFSNTDMIIQALHQYHLPTSFDFKIDDIFHILKMDKKRREQSIQMILLSDIGHAMIESISMDELRTYLTKISVTA